MKEFDFDKIGGSKIVKYVLSVDSPCVVISKETCRAVILPYKDQVKDLIESHPRVLHGELNDAKYDVSIGMLTLQTSLSNEQDAMVFLDENGVRKLAIVGEKRYRDWLEKE